MNEPINPLGRVEVVSHDGEIVKRTELKITREPIAEDWRAAWINRGCKDAWCSVVFYGEIKAGAALASYGGEVWPTAWPDWFSVPSERTVNNVGMIFLTDAGAKALRAIFKDCPGCAGTVDNHSSFCPAKDAGNSGFGHGFLPEFND